MPADLRGRVFALEGLLQTITECSSQVSALQQIHNNKKKFTIKIQKILAAFCGLCHRLPRVDPTPDRRGGLNIRGLHPSLLDVVFLLWTSPRRRRICPSAPMTTLAPREPPAPLFTKKGGASSAHFSYGRASHVVVLYNLYDLMHKSHFISTMYSLRSSPLPSPFLWSPLFSPPSPLSLSQLPIFFSLQDKVPPSFPFPQTSLSLSPQKPRVRLFFLKMIPPPLLASPSPPPSPHDLKASLCGQQRRAALQFLLIILFPVDSKVQKSLPPH